MIINGEVIKIKFVKLMSYIYTMLCVVRKYVINFERLKADFYDTPIGLVKTRECWYTEVTLFGYKHQIIRRYLDYRKNYT